MESPQPKNAEAPELDAGATESPATEATGATPSNKNFETIALSQPIMRGEKKIDGLTIRKPKAGELRGLALQDIIGTDITALLKLIPRISDPVLTDAEAQDLDPSDLTEIGGAVRGFFMTPAERKFMEAMIAEQQPKT